ncbi:hypothetical protein C8Q77DRAFT_923050 [Trametes polyzona]|nr:hypothetical protein C8Q77DRAFT_923050 [Trametes polyzona]
MPSRDASHHPISAAATPFPVNTKPRIPPHNVVLASPYGRHDRPSLVSQGWHHGEPPRVRATCDWASRARRFSGPPPLATFPPRCPHGWGPFLSVSGRRVWKCNARAGLLGTRVDRLGFESWMRARALERSLRPPAHSLDAIASIMLSQTCSNLRCDTDYTAADTVTYYFTKAILTNMSSHVHVHFHIFPSGFPIATLLALPTDVRLRAQTQDVAFRQYRTRFLATPPVRGPLERRCSALSVCSSHSRQPAVPHTRVPANHIPERHAQPRVSPQVSGNDEIVSSQTASSDGGHSGCGARGKRCRRRRSGRKPRQRHRRAGPRPSNRSRVVLALHMVRARGYGSEGVAPARTVLVPIEVCVVRYTTTGTHARPPPSPSRVLYMAPPHPYMGM